MRVHDDPRIHGILCNGLRVAIRHIQLIHRPARLCIQIIPAVPPGILLAQRHRIPIGLTVAIELYRDACRTDAVPVVAVLPHLADGNIRRVHDGRRLFGRRLCVGLLLLGLLLLRRRCPLLLGVLLSVSAIPADSPNLPDTVYPAIVRCVACIHPFSVDLVLIIEGIVLVAVGVLQLVPRCLAVNITALPGKVLVMIADAFSVLPDLRPADGDNRASGVLLVFIKAEQTGAGDLVRSYAGYLSILRNIIIDLVVAGDVDDVPAIPHVLVVDFQDRFLPLAGVVNRTILKVDGDVVLACTIVRVDIDDLAG